MAILWPKGSLAKYLFPPAVKSDEPLHLHFGLRQPLRSVGTGACFRPWCSMVSLGVDPDLPDLEEFVASVSPKSDPGGDDPWSPSLRRSHRPEVPPIQTPLHEPKMFSGDWRCRSCDGEDYGPLDDSVWECLACGSRSFYNTRQSVKEVTDRGTWMYMPHSGEEKTATSSSRRRQRRRQSRNGPPSEPDNFETAESEHPTNDPTVDPEPLPGRDLPPPPELPRQDPVVRGGRGRGKGGGHQEGPSGSITSTDGRLLKTLQQLVGKEDAEWSLAKGPAKGVRWKTGQPPAPPVWKYDREDL